mmetsp:Transcript_11434/g.32920  ORF Transcript_11434/g.32920 Transcript_11434/m.32920 type:complete len:219 (+) Transcript_11434:176-832(+)|eukprot:CAMPEP_0172367038 /NCGR_PEP_ID=MMETSP1060-20121228/18465_1 /TAXON_ID=37318 /ORGANISM="Pseudo-nitzschia pungens, Strain cf. cingulata" /LENGTH=218 /DNA_ID=CAMNT_0013091105 /DNA_START=84 /DNA_END=740 /DNA_ORIENTATION=+
MVSKAFTALGHLQDYADASAKAHDELKSCMWQLTKSRRNVRSGIIGVDSTTAYTAELLREELRAQLRVVDGTSDGNDAADLVDEDAVKDESSRTTTKSPPKWKVRNILLEIEKSKEAKESTIPSKSPETDTGLRQRKKTDTNEATSPSSSWTMIREADLDDEDEEERILQTDPIKLFGGYFTARELKVAQSNARKALDGYIEAANEAAKLLALLHEKK